MTSEHTRFYAQAFPEPTRVLGLLLKPFCLGHKILLHRLGNSFVDGGSVTYDDLALAAYICHHTYEDATEALQSPDLDEALRDWERQLSQPLWRQRWFLKAPSVIDLHGNEARFSEYIAAASKPPHYIVNQEKCSEVEAPMDQVLLSSLLSGTGATLSEVFNMPYGLALSVWMTQKACAGLLRLTPEETIDDALASAKALHEKFVADGVIPGGNGG